MKPDQPFSDREAESGCGRMREERDRGWVSRGERERERVGEMMIGGERGRGITCVEEMKL